MFEKYLGLTVEEAEAMAIADGYDFKYEHEETELTDGSVWVEEGFYLSATWLHDLMYFYLEDGVVSEYCAAEQWLQKFLAHGLDILKVMC